ncbi:MAG: LysR family transcriptional regulator [Halobacteriovoraceae bacterium]|nr:LysR family transcriptional regulator [Halobacteriovoraceae bacterium]MCB9095548.1 LysR family transcriptional regulator [Halobacteriovoraceae bacterium]
MLDLNKFLYFQEVARLGSISSASKSLHISQPALSLQIKALEEQIGEELFIRSGRSLILTPLGRELSLKAHELTNWEQEVSDLIQNEKKLSGEIKIGTYTTASSYLLSNPVKNFLNANPKVSINYNYQTTEEILRKLKHYELDCAILSGVKQAQDFDFQLILRTKMLLVTSVSYNAPKSINAKQIEDLDFLSYSIPEDYCYLDIQKKFRKHLAKSTKPITTENFETLKQGVISGAGVSFIPEYIIKKELDEKIIRKIKIKDKKEMEIDFYFINLSKRKSIPKIQSFKDLLIDYFSSYDHYSSGQGDI